MHKKKAISILALGLSLALLGQLSPVFGVSAAPVAAAEQAVKSVSTYGIQLGMSAAQVEQKLGKPARKDPSHTGVEWWIYNKDLNNYIQVGIQNSKVVTLFTNGAKINIGGITIGSTTKALQDAWGAPQNTLAITPSLRIQDNTLKHPTYLQNNQVITFSIDQLGGNKVAGVRISTPEHFATIAMGLMYPIVYTQLPAQPKLTDAQIKQAAIAYEKENFDLLNVARLRAKLPVLTWDEQVAAVARAHSNDMAQHNYFSHTSPTTGSPFDRLKKAGIRYSYAGENIAYGQLDGIEVHMGWMNSSGHRQNLLNQNFKQLGVGVVIKDGRPFYTQNFVSK
ncbi:CAP-associated domain-containing protein [Brevibacillus agri]|uniref:CAP domain-containing protein n=1 Tax=Brevibacillus agri TaxID=51101 RepID=UPI00286FC0DA|nr:CAP-associated domain-containing protein [Brevibacillus agri]MDR9507596.1 CAP-associated domain-containing protein [Brevibacillus agri]